MSGLVEEILAGLNRGTPEEVGDAAARAVSLFEMARGQRPFVEDLQPTARDLTDDGIAELVRGLVEAVEGAPTSSRSGPLVWALGKRFDGGMRPLFLRLLRANVDGDPDVLYQTIIALSNLEEPALADVAILSVHDRDENRRLALRILERS